MEGGYIMVANILAIIVAILAVWNVVLGRQKKKVEGKVRDLEQEKYRETYNAVKEERERAARRLRDMLDNYRGPGGGQA
jgi:signal transduction histidine kinase